MLRRPQAVLFDLDGTLVDSAPDLVATLGWLRSRHQLRPIDLKGMGALASRGALALIEAGFADRPDIDRSLLREQFLRRYADHLWQESRIYDGVEALLDRLGSLGLALAVVTNKPKVLADALIQSAGWSGLFQHVVGGGCTALAKPHPAPVLEACRRLGVNPAEAWMVGDDRRDIEAGRGAGSLTFAAAWGYLAGEDPNSWGPHRVISTPRELHSIVNETNDL